MSEPVRSSDSFDSSATAHHGLSGIAYEAGELHRLLVESVQDYAIFALDPHGYILSWNPGAKRFKGYEADEIIGKHFSIFYPRERVEEGFPDYELREAARTGRFEDEGWRVRKDGTRFWANVVITALRAPDGTLVGFAKVTRDLSERRAAEEALRLSEERFRLLVQGVKDYAIFMLDPEGRVATWNEGAERIKGYTADEIIGKHFSIFYPPDLVAEKFPQHELEVAARTGKFEHEGWRIRKDGSRFWANVVITAVRDSSNKLVGFSKVTRDLTERRAAEQRAIETSSRLAAEEAARRAADVARDRAERLQSATSALSAAYTIPDVVRVVIDYGYPLFGVEAGAIALTDAARANATILAYRGFSTPPGPNPTPLDVGTPMGLAIRQGVPVVCNSRAERDAQFPLVATTLTEYESTIVVPLMSRGLAIGAVSMHWREKGLAEDDIVLYKAFGQQCSQALDRATLYEAEQQARHDAEEARRRADEARHRADEANRAKSEFLAAMSHELRTPLNAIGGYAELLLLDVRGTLAPEQRLDLERIRRSQQHLLAIINDLLNFSRIEAGRIEYNIQSVSAKTMLESVKQMIAPQALAKGLDFRVEDCEPEVMLRVDEGKTEQILLNILSNAVKFTDANGHIALECEPGKRFVTFRVCDSGLGIAEDQLERIFEPFVQIGRSLSHNREGTGLGLAISRDLARAMGGNIVVESVVGHGSVFTVTLPRATE